MRQIRSLRLSTTRGRAPEASCASGMSTILAKRAALHQHAGEAGQVARRGVVAGLVEPDRVGVARVARARASAARAFISATNASREPETPSARVTAASFALSSSSASSRSCTVMRSPCTQVDPRLRGHRVVGGRGEDVARLRLLEREQRGHQLRGAGDRALCVGVLGEHHVPSRASTTMAARAPGTERRTLRRGGAGPRPPRRAQRPRASVRRPSSLAQLDLLARDQCLRVELGVQLLESLDRRSRSSAAMPPSVSPALTV